MGHDSQITGKNKNNKHVHIKSNGNICSTTKDISNALGENFQKNSSSTNYSKNFQNIKQEREKEHLNFMSLNHEKYNVQYRSGGFSKSPPPTPPHPQLVGSGFGWKGLNFSIPRWFHPGRWIHCVPVVKVA